MTATSRPSLETRVWAGSRPARETAASGVRARIPRVCLVTPTHIAHNPRLVKEADTLAAAGYDVRVVGCQLAAWIAERDADLARGRAWRYDVVRAVPSGPWSGWLRIRSHVRMRLYQFLSGRITPRGGARALVRFYPELLGKVCREPADLYVAHTLEALPVAAAAAGQFGARLGYDAEDLYTGELEPTQQGSLRQRLVERVEDAYIRACDYVSAPSPEVGAVLARIYGIPEPVVLHNVFRWADRERLDGLVKDRRGFSLSLYWYSQTVGPDRGLEDAIRACGLLRGSFTSGAPSATARGGDSPRWPVSAEPGIGWSFTARCRRTTSSRERPSTTWGSPSSRQSPRAVG